MSTYFVSGITGKVGGATARRLLEQGHHVRSLARDPGKAAAWTQQGVDIRGGAFEDAAAVAAALEGADGAYLMVPPILAPVPGFPEARAIAASFRDALRRSPPARVVVLSSIGSQQPHGLGLITSTHILEQTLDDLPMPAAFVRAGAFLDNFIYSIQSAAASGYLDTYLAPPDRPVPMVATPDIGRVVAELLASNWTGKRIVELGSRYSPAALARALTEVLGRPIQARSIPRDQWATRLQALGLRPGTTGAYEEMEDGFNAGWIDFGVPGTEPIAATTTPLELFAAAAAQTGDQPRR